MHMEEGLTFSTSIVHSENTNFVSIEYVPEKVQGTNIMGLLFGFDRIPCEPLMKIYRKFTEINEYFYFGTYFLISDDIFCCVCDTSICTANFTLRFLLQNNARNRQGVIDLSALWPQNATLTPGGCSWWSIPDEVSKVKLLEPQHYFSCFG